MHYTDLGLTKEQYEECINLIIDKQINKTADVDWQEICKKYNLPYNYDSLRKANNTIFGGCYVADYLKGKNFELENEIENIKRSFKTESKINKDGTYSSSKLLDMSEEQSKDTSYILS